MSKSGSHGGSRRGSGASCESRALSVTNKHQRKSRVLGPCVQGPARPGARRGGAAAAAQPPKVAPGRPGPGARAPQPPTSSRA